MVVERFLRFFYLIRSFPVIVACVLMLYSGGVARAGLIDRSDFGPSAILEDLNSVPFPLGTGRVSGELDLGFIEISTGSGLFSVPGVGWICHVKCLASVQDVDFFTVVFDLPVSKAGALVGRANPWRNDLEAFFFGETGTLLGSAQVSQISNEPFSFVGFQTEDELIKYMRFNDPYQSPPQNNEVFAIEDLIYELPPSNVAPIVAAGTNQTITLPITASLDGTVSDDGLPDPPGSVTSTWTKVSGPGTVTFANASAVDTSASFSLAGVYVLQLAANDGALQNNAQVTITVNPTPLNQAPSVNAGVMQTVTLPSLASLNGTVSDDGLPSGTLTTIWSKVSGPGSVIFGNPNAVDTTASFTLPGTYVLRLLANDSALMNNADVTITVNPNPALKVPDVRGTWTEGPFSVSTTSCQDPADNGSYSDPGGETYTITNQTGASFSVSRVDTVIDGGDTIVQKTNCSGTVEAGGSVNVSCTYSVNLNGGFWYSGTSTLTGSLVGNTLTYTHSGRDLVGDTCQWTQTGTDTRSGSVPPPLPIPINDPHDLNGDGKADLVWQNDISHVVAIWLMNGANIGSFAFLGSVPTEWEIKGIGDVNGDGQADVVWKNARSHLVAIWFMNGLTISSIGFPGGVSPWWTLEAVGDTNGDGKADLVWVNGNTGQVAVWLMNGAIIALAHAKFPLAPVAGDWPNWQLEGTGDVDGNGTADVIWQNTVTGQVTVWLMNGLTLISSVGLPEIPPTYWKIAGMGDIDGNGTSDMVWRNTLNGATAIWFMNGGTIGSFGFPPGVPLAWRISQVGDLNGDGKADVVWQNTNGTVAVWLMNGVTITSVGFPGSAPTTWKIQP